METDLWIEQHSPIAADKLHALGYVNLVWNSAEYMLSALLAYVSELGERRCHMLTYGLGDTSIIDRIKAFAGDRNFTPAMMSSLDWGLSAYDVCRVNRNHLNHFALTTRGQGWGLRMHRVLRGPRRELMPLPDSLEDIRRVGEEIEALRNFLERLTLASGTWNDANAMPPPSPETMAMPTALHKMELGSD